jgi:hypothetical protein
MPTDLTALLPPDPISTALGMVPGTIVANIIDGAQLGTGLNARMLDAATPAVFTPTVFIVMQTPWIYDRNPDMRNMIKTLIEAHAKSITGVDFGYTVDTEDGPVGHDGQTMDVPTKTKRSKPSPSITFNELTGNLVWRVFEKWIKDIQHPDTNISTSVNNQPRMSGTYSMSMLGIQFDPTGLPNNILGAAFYTNMFPTDIGQFGFERNVGTARTMERTIQFSAMVMHNQYTEALGREIAAGLRLATLDFSNRLTKVNVTDPMLSRIGLEREVDDAVNRVKPLTSPFLTPTTTTP